MKPYPLRSGITDDERKVLVSFRDNVCEEIARDPIPLAVEAVLERLMKNMANDVLAVTGFYEANLVVSDEGVSPENPAELHVPIHAFNEETYALSEQLDTHYQIGGDRSGIYESDRELFHNYIGPLCKKMFAYFGDDSAKLINYLLVWSSRDNGGQSMRQKTLSFTDIEHYSEAEHLALTKQLLDFHDDAHLTEGDIAAAFSRFVGQLPAFKNSGKESEFGKTMDCYLRLFLQSADVRFKAKILFQNYRLSTYTRLSEAIVRQGYRTLLSMDYMNEGDIWLFIRDRLEKEALQKHDKLLNETDIAIDAAKVPDYINIVELEEEVRAEAPQTDTDEKIEINEDKIIVDSHIEDIVLKSINDKFSDLLRVVELAQEEMAKQSTNEEVTSSVTEEARRMFEVISALGCLTAEEYALWIKASAFLKDAKDEEWEFERGSLRDVVEAEAFKVEFECLEEQQLYNVLAAKQREFAAKVFSEVKRFPYADGDDEEETRGKMSYKVGVPTFASEHRELNCFTGPWLTASLLMEGGIRYSDLYYVSVNEGAGNGLRASTHGALLMLLCDGSSMFIDYGHHTCGRHFSISVLKNGTSKNTLDYLFRQCDALEKWGRKMYGDPVHVQIDPDLAAKLGVYSDMHIMPLDQGFAATSLLHTGIELQNEGKTEEALLAFELGLTSFPTSPDLLARAADLEMQKGNYLRASEYLLRALAEYSGHLLANYFSGIFLEKAGDEIGAEKLFALVGSDQRPAWGDMSFQKWAKEYSDAKRTLRCLRDEKEAISLQHEQGALLTPIEDHLL